MAGYEKQMHAKFVMEETFAKIYHAKHNAAFQAWVENAGVKRKYIHPDEVELPPAILLKKIKTDMLELFRNIYIGKQTKGEEKTINTFLKFLKHKKCVGGLHHTFKRLTDAVLTEIISGSTFLQLASGQLVRNYVQCQHPANFFYIVVKGQIKLYQQEEHRLALETLETLKKQPQYIHQADVGELKVVLNESESFGEQNLILNHPQYYTAIASAPSLLFAIPRSLFYKYLIQFYKDLQETYEKTEFLRKVPMFKNLGYARILRISKLLKPLSRASKYTLIKSGTMCDKVIFIQSGEARVTINPNTKHSVSILSKEQQNEIVEIQKRNKKKMFIGEHRVKRFKNNQHDTRNKKKIDVLILSANQFWGEASLLDKNLLRYENDQRMTSDIIDTSGVIYMSKNQHVEMANVISINKLTGYVLLKDELPYFIDIIHGTRCLKDISSLYEERKGLIRKRIEEENEFLQQKSKPRSKSPKHRIVNNELKHNNTNGEMYVLPYVQNIAYDDNAVVAGKTLSKNGFSPTKATTTKRNVVSYRHCTDNINCKSNIQNQVDGYLKPSVSPIKQNLAMLVNATQHGERNKLKWQRIKQKKQVLNITPIKKITTKLNYERQNKNTRSVNKSQSDSNLIVAGSGAIHLNDELEQYIGKVMYKNSIQGTRKAIKYPTTSKLPTKNLPLKPLIRRLHSVIECHKTTAQLMHPTRNELNRTGVFDNSKDKWLHLKQNNSPEKRRHALNRARNARTLKTNDKVRVMLLESQLFQERYAEQYFQHPSLQMSKSGKIILDPFGVLHGDA